MKIFRDTLRIRCLPLTLLIVGILFFPVFLLAQTTGSAASNIKLNIKIGNLEYVRDLGEYIAAFYAFFVTSAGILAVVMMTWGGFRWIMAAGNAQKIGEAKETILGALTGLVLALTSYILLNTINPSIVKLTPISLPIPQPSSQGFASTLCSFDKELDSSQKPVVCGVVINVNPKSSSPEQCMGVRVFDTNEYCQVESQEMGGEKMLNGTRQSVIQLAGYEEASLKTSDEEYCGDVFTDRDTLDSLALNPSLLLINHLIINKIFRDKTLVGTDCNDMTVGSTNYTQRCYLLGSAGNYKEKDGVVDALSKVVELLAGKNFVFGNVFNMGCRGEFNKQGVKF